MTLTEGFRHYVVRGAALRPQPGSVLWHVRGDWLAMASLTVIILIIVVAIFAPWIARRRGAARARLRARLVAVTDVYVWKIVRRDLGLDRRAVEATLRELVAAVVA